MTDAEKPELRHRYGSSVPGWVAPVGLGIMTLALSVSLAAWFAGTRPSPSALFWAPLGAVTAFLPRLWSGEVVADGRGIRSRPFIRVAWSDVDCVVRPSEFDDVVRVVLRGGREKITGFPPPFAEGLAAIGGRPLK